MTEIAVNIQQQGYSVSADGVGSRTLQGDREGALFGGTIQDKYRQWLLGGKVFQASFATPGGTATIEANATLDLVESFFRMTCPSSHVLVPLFFSCDNIAVWTTADAMYHWTTDTDTFTSGGADPTVINHANQGSGDSVLGTTAMQNIKDGDSPLVEAGQTNPRLISTKTKLTGDLFSPLVYNVLNGDPYTYIHGESSWNVVFENASAVECHYLAIWAELDKNTLVNS